MPGYYLSDAVYQLHDSAQITRSLCRHCLGVQGKGPLPGLRTTDTASGHCPASISNTYERPADEYLNERSAAAGSPGLLGAGTAGSGPT